MNAAFKFLIISLMGLALLAGCAGDGNTAEEVIAQGTPVNVMTLKKTEIDNLRTLVGKTQPVQEISVYAKVPGIVTQIGPEVGQPVEKGTLLFSVEDKDIRLQVEQALAGLNSARANLTRSGGGAAELQLAQLRSSLAQAQLMYQDAQAALDSAKILYDAGAVSKLELDTSETRAKTAFQQYETARKALELTENTINKENLAVASAQVQQAQAAYDLAKSQLGNARATSPISGLVSVRNATVGEILSSAAPAYTVVDLSSVVVEIQVMQELINTLSAGTQVSLDISAAGSEPFLGTIVAVSPSVDPRTQAYLVKIEVPNPEGRIKGGMLASVRLVTASRGQVLVVPMDAVLDDRGKSVLFVVEGDTAVRKEVTMGLSDGAFVEVQGPLEEGMQIVIKGQGFLQDGAKVMVVE